MSYLRFSFSYSCVFYDISMYSMRYNVSNRLRRGGIFIFHSFGIRYSIGHVVRGGIIHKCELICDRGLDIFRLQSIY